MSEYKHRPRGGQEGIACSKKELTQAAIYLGSTYLDEVIPLPGVSLPEQKLRLAHCIKHEDEGNMETVYWELTDGSHGWCCNHCGKVVQWG